MVAPPHRLRSARLASGGTRAAGLPSPRGLRTQAVAVPAGVPRARALVGSGDGAAPGQGATPEDAAQLDTPVAQLRMEAVAVRTTVLLCCALHARLSAALNHALCRCCSEFLAEEQKRKGKVLSIWSSDYRRIYFNRWHDAIAEIKARRPAGHGFFAELSVSRTIVVEPAMSDQWPQDN